jgi:Flp pilus assembly protein TadG
MVTAETAIVLPALVFVLAGALWVLVVVAGQLRCIDAARAGARLAARGEAGATAVDAARRAAPDGAVVTVRRADGDVAVTVTAVVRPFGGWAGRLAPARVSSTAEALDETALPERSP